MAEPQRLEWSGQLGGQRSGRRHGHFCCSGTAIFQSAGTQPAALVTIADVFHRPQPTCR